MVRDGSGNDKRAAVSGFCLIPLCHTPHGPALSSQHDMYKIVGRPIVENVLAGFNSTVAVYGQTGSGKVGASGPGAACLGGQERCGVPYTSCDMKSL